MHFHLPKPLHGWREFIGEVGIIVLGVLIALAAERVAEEWQWHQRTAQTRRAIFDELEPDALFAIERVAIEQCVRERITALAAKLNRDEPRWTGDPMNLGTPKEPLGAAIFKTGLAVAYRSASRPWVTDEWDTAKSTGVIDHMSPADVHRLAIIYSHVNGLRALNNEETSIAPQLNFLSLDQRLQPQTRAEALMILGKLDSLNSLQAVIARELLDGLQKLRLRLAPINIGRANEPFTHARSRLLNEDRARFGRCVVVT